MEHHTYTKSDSKSWTVEQTRRLVTKRISADHMFKKPSLRSDRDWKAFKETAKIDDFDGKELRNKWQALLQVYLNMRNGISAPITNQIIAAINEKWEFFGEIHQFMIKKNDHHSYAQNATNDLNAQSKVTKQVTKNVTIEVAPEIVPPSPKTPKMVVQIKTEIGEDANDNGVEVVVAPEPFVFIPETAKNVPPNQQDNAKEVEGEKGFIAPTKNKTTNRFLTPPIGERGPLSQSLPPTPSDDYNKTSAEPKARKSRKRPAEEELCENHKYCRHRCRYFQLMEKHLIALGRAVSKIVIPLATFLDVEIEVTGLEEFFAADSEPSQVGSDSSTEEDSDQ
ncbi:uncharacterized protein [Drosophila pseudoobscura]|uniref:Uncharacterized protein n=1 Tax=Drosophila pseudoobscura pseudoobscura TaxID=46245 RepID=A0A6I8UZR7_DROPS|nr:uncharacterized protein LOC6901627 [Drosophila pseudoobscura]